MQFQQCALLMCNLVSIVHRLCNLPCFCYAATIVIVWLRHKYTLYLGYTAEEEVGFVCLSVCLYVYLHNTCLLAFAEACLLHVFVIDCKRLYVSVTPTKHRELYYDDLRRTMIAKSERRAVGIRTMTETEKHTFIFKKRRKAKCKNYIQCNV